MRIIYLPLYADVEPFFSHREAQARTSFRSNMNDVYWIAGSENCDTHFDKNTRILTLPVPEKFENIYKKTILAFKWLIENEDFDYLIRTNTSTYFRLSEVENCVRNLGYPKYLAAGEFGYSPLAFNAKINNGQFLAGTGIIVSRDLISRIILVDDTKWNSLPDDVAISLSISSLGVTFKKLTRVDITDYKSFSIGSHYRVKSWTDSKVTFQRFLELDSLLKTKKSWRYAALLKFHSHEFKRYRGDFPFRFGLNSLRWVRQIIRYQIMDWRTLLWILGKND